jgi:mRNA interferase MazF
MDKNIERGQVWYHVPTVTPAGHIQQGPRPVIIVSNNQCNKNSPVVLVVPCTTQIKKNLPTHVLFIMNKQVNIALTEQAGPVNVDELTNLKYILEDYIMDQIDNALKIAFGLAPVPSNRRFNPNYSIPREPVKKEPIGNQVEKFYKRYPDYKPEEPKEPKKRNEWTDDKIKQFIEDCFSLSTEAVCAKYNISKATMKNYLRKFRSK